MHVPLLATVCYDLFASLRLSVSFCSLLSEIKTDMMDTTRSWNRAAVNRSHAKAPRRKAWLRLASSFLAPSNLQLYQRPVMHVPLLATVCYDLPKFWPSYRFGGFPAPSPPASFCSSINRCLASATSGLPG